MAQEKAFQEGFSEAVVPGYNLTVFVSGVKADVAVQAYAGRLLVINVSSLGVEAMPEVVDLDGRAVYFNFTRGAAFGGPSRLAVNVYAPQLEVNNLKIHIDVGSIRVLDVAARSLDLYAALGQICLNATKLFDGGRYTVATQTGNIVIALPASQGFTLNATTINGQIYLSGKPTSTHFYGELNGGGPLVVAYSVDGSVRVETP